MSDAIRHFRKYLTTHDTLRREVKGLPSLHPATQRASEAEVWLSIMHADATVRRVLELSDEELFWHTDDLLSIARAITARVTAMED